jgi:hypothetical protein
VKRFRKASCPIVERLVCSLMFHGRNNGKKLMAVRIVRHTFEIIHLLTGEVIYCQKKSFKNLFQIIFFRIHSKYSSTPLLIVDHVKIQHVLVVLVPSDDKLSMYHHYDGLTKHFIYSAQVEIKILLKKISIYFFRCT